MPLGNRLHTHLQQDGHIICSMQLHASAWLDDGEWKAFPILETPFLKDNFGTPRAGSLAQSGPGSIIAGEKSLFSLGILLIELWLEEPIETLAIPEELTADNDYQKTASRLLEIFRNAGDRYGLAVTRCINGMDGHTSSGTGSQDDDYKGDVPTNILLLLEDNLEAIQILFARKIQD
ncbi:hypothetical protein EDC01DRAFT_760429 [Geopyxis carbonaria]|nr:hypothetical protein EDC01DRAFT_760429 [Geopyxis carbonaria]